MKYNHQMICRGQISHQTHSLMIVSRDRKGKSCMYLRNQDDAWDLLSKGCTTDGGFNLKALCMSEYKGSVYE